MGWKHLLSGFCIGMVLVACAGNAPIEAVATAVPVAVVPETLSEEVIREDEAEAPDETAVMVVKGALKGYVWHDLCAAAPTADGLVASDDCVEVAEGRFEADGQRASDEPGIGELLVTLGAGECPSIGVAATFTDRDGFFTFINLDEGVYCLAVDPNHNQNSTLMLPGTWTAPIATSSDSRFDGRVTLQLGAGEEREINFGWDYALLPDASGLAGVCVDSVEFVDDVTIPDGTILAANSDFEKTWRLRNSGSCTWSTGYALIFDAGDKMGETTVIPIVEPVVPGAEVALSVTLTAPDEAGSYRGDWLLFNADTRTQFGTGVSGEVPIWVQIVVE